MNCCAIPDHALCRYAGNSAKADRDYFFPSDGSDGHFVRIRRIAQVVERDPCGLILDRDHNAALNILHRAVLRPEAANVIHVWDERWPGNLKTEGILN